MDAILARRRFWPFMSPWLRGLSMAVLGDGGQNTEVGSAREGEVQGVGREKKNDSKEAGEVSHSQVLTLRGPSAGKCF